MSSSTLVQGKKDGAYRAVNEPYIFSHLLQYIWNVSCQSKTCHTSKGGSTPH